MHRDIGRLGKVESAIVARIVEAQAEGLDRMVVSVETFEVLLADIAKAHLARDGKM